MTAIKLEAFGGMLPAWDSRLLPEGQADFARNCYLFSGSLIGWRKPKLLRQLLDSTAKYVYRIPNKNTNDTSILAADSKWLEFTDPDTNVLRSPIVQDQFDRYYTASPSDKPRYNTYDRIVNDDPWWLLGVPASGCAPGVTVTGGGDTSQSGFVNIQPSGGAASYQAGNSIILVPIILDGSMLLQDIVFTPTLVSPFVHFKGVVYSDLNGQPSQLLAVGVEGTVVNNAPATSAFTNGLAVVANVRYWIGVMFDGAITTVNYDNTNGGVIYSATYDNGAPDALNSGSIVPIISPQLYADLIGASVYTARAYVYTWVTAYGEEGPPSPPSVVNGWSNGVWHVELFTPPAKDLGVDYVDPEDLLTKHAERYITKTRIYRSITNQAGQGTYFFVAEIPVTQASYEDTRSDAEVALEAQLTSLYWFPPPEDMQGIETFPNGITVGFRANEVWFSEVYRPHAWPPGYVLTTEFPIVGIGICGQAIVVCTQGTPYLINGVNPTTMAMTKINLREPCIHRGSIVSTDTTVLFGSQNGLIQISQSGAGQNITEGWITRERWQELTPIKLIRAVKLATNYFAFGSRVGSPPIREGYTIELSDQDKTSFSIWPQAGGHRLGFMSMSTPNGFDIDNVELDPWTSTGLLVQNGAIYYYDFTDQSPEIVPYLWRSKTYQQLARRNFQACRIWFSVPDSTPPQVDRDVDDPQATLGPNQYGILRVYADGQLWTTREIRKSGELLRIYSGKTTEMWQFEVEGRINISNLQVATSVKELALV